jgi:hypothetical protein
MQQCRAPRREGPSAEGRSGGDSYVTNLHMIYPLALYIVAVHRSASSRRAYSFNYMYVRYTVLAIVRLLYFTHTYMTSSSLSFGFAISMSVPFRSDDARSIHNRSG